MNGKDAGSIRRLGGASLACVAGGVEDDTSVYYDIGKAVGKAYAYTKLKVGDFYEWVDNL